MNKCIRISKEKPTPADRKTYADAVFSLVGGKGYKCFVQTFGCQQNEADSERIAGMAAEMGYSITDNPDEADLIVVNTCAVREHAEKKALSLIGQYKHCKNNKKELVIAVCGCMPSQEHRADEIKHNEVGDQVDDAHRNAVNKLRNACTADSCEEVCPFLCRCGKVDIVLFARIEDDADRYGRNAAENSR